MPINAATYSQALNTINPDTRQNYTPAEINAHILSQPGGRDAIQGMQTQGGLRYPGMILQQGLSGLENTMGLPSEAMNLANKYLFNPVATALGGRAVPDFPLTTQDMTQETNKLGLTNSPSLMPGAGPYPGVENVLASASRGVGAALPTGGLGAAGAAGAAGSALQQVFPDISPWIPAVVGAGAGLSVAGAKSLLSGPSSIKEIQKSLQTSLGTPNANLYTAGSALQKEIADTRAAGGFGPLSSIPKNDANQLLNQKPITAARTVLNDPALMPIVRQESPEIADHLASGMIGQSAPMWNNLSTVSQRADAILPDLAIRGQLEKSLAQAKGSKYGVTEPLMAMGVGGALGGVASHLLASHFPALHGGIGEALGVELGSTGALALDAMRSRFAAHAILDPWVRREALSSGLGAAAGSQPGSPLQ